MPFHKSRFLTIIGGGLLIETDFSSSEEEEEDASSESGLELRWLKKLLVAFFGGSRVVERVLENLNLYL